jgi:hypothetical protein
MSKSQSSFARPSLFCALAETVGQKAPLFSGPKHRSPPDLHRIRQFGLILRFPPLPAMQKPVYTFHHKLLEFLRQDLSLSFTLGYALLIVIGMEFSNAYYQLWGIDIFHYADLSYFLLVPFQDIRVISFAAFSMACLALVYGLHMKYDKGTTPLSKWLNLGFVPGTRGHYYYTIVSYLIGAAVYLNFSAHLLAEIKWGLFKKTPPKSWEWVVLAPEAEGEAPLRRRFLGMASTFVFAIDSGMTQVQSFPVETRVLSIETGSVKDKKGFWFLK